MSDLACIVTADQITISLDGRYRSFRRDTPVGQKLYEAVKSQASLEEIRSIADVDVWSATKSFGGGVVTLDDRDRLRLNGVVVDYGLASVIKRMADEGFDVEPLAAFLKNVDENPNKGIANDLYDFLSRGRLPITPDGYFHAFKRVTDNFLDFHSRTVSYALGSVVEMDRSACDENRVRECSSGLHACQFDYLNEFHGGAGKIIVVKINPRDVTAIPHDYNKAKLRSCRMEVLAEIPYDDAKEHFSHSVDSRYSEEDATPHDDATAEDGVTSVEKNWFAEGVTAGVVDGENDHKLGYDYEPVVDYPYAVSTDADRQRFSAGYFLGYAEGWGQIEDDDHISEDDDGDTGYYA